jgi:hypothetical protein
MDLPEGQREQSRLGFQSGPRWLLQAIGGALIFSLYNFKEHV